MLEISFAQEAQGEVSVLKVNGFLSRISSPFRSSRYFVDVFGFLGSPWFSTKRQEVLRFCWGPNSSQGLSDPIVFKISDQLPVAGDECVFFDPLAARY